MTPRQAVTLGANHLVIGRPITEAADPAPPPRRSRASRTPSNAVEAKICGLSTPETLDAAVRFGARFVGFVTYPKSPRHIATETMRALGQRVPKTVTRVGLFVDPDDALLDEKIATGALDLLQLHGGETPERVAAISRAPACR